MGVDGFILPMTSKKEDIKKVVKYAKYPPIGQRGLSTMRAHTFYNSPKDLNKYMNEANEKIEVYAQIETKEGVINYKDIINTSGVSGVFIGPNDLSSSYNHPGAVESKEVLEAINYINNNKEKKIGIITSNQKLIKFAKENAFDIISIGSELSMLKDASKQLIEKYKD